MFQANEKIFGVHIQGNFCISWHFRVIVYENDTTFGYSVQVAEYSTTFKIGHTIIVNMTTRDNFKQHNYVL